MIFIKIVVRNNKRAKTSKAQVEEDEDEDGYLNNIIFLDEQMEDIPIRDKRQEEV